MGSRRAKPGIAGLIDSASVVVCCGSGGVGKTTTAAAIAVEAARRGRRVVVVTIDPAKRLADALGLSGSLDNEPRAVDGALLGDPDLELWAMMLDARATFDSVVRRHARDEAQVGRILDNAFYRNVASRLSGSQEYMAAEKLYELHNDERFDLVVVDTPPSREALDFLDAPQKLMNFLDHRVYRWLVAPTRGGLKVLNVAAQPIIRTIGRVIGADVLADAITFFRAFEGIESGFRERARAVQTLLRSRSTRYVVVASPRRDTVEEALYFVGQLGREGVDVGALVLNRMLPEFGRGSSASARTAARKAIREGNEELAALHRNLADLRAMSEAEATAVEPVIAAVATAPVVRLEQRPEDVHDLVAILSLADELVAH